MVNMNSKDSHNWPLWWRVGILINISFYNLLGNAFAAGVTPLFGLLFAEFHCTVTQAGHLASYALLTLGLSNILALPGSALVGKRYLVLISQLVFLATNIWAANAQSYNSLLATRIVGGLAAGVIEAIGPVFVVETFAEKQLSRALVVYTAMLALGAGFGPLFSGLIAKNLHGWRWFFWIMAIVTGINFLLSLVMLPETSDEFTLKYEPGSREPEIPKSDDLDHKSHHVEGVAESKATDYTPVDEDVSPRQSWYLIWRENSFYIPIPKMSKTSVFKSLRDLILLMGMPPVTLAILIYGMSIGWTLVVSILVSAIFQSPPFLWNPQQMGLYGISGIIGIVLGIPVGGNLSDYLSHRSAAKNTGVHRPESRLPALILPFLLSPLGVILVGLYLNRGQIWIPEAAGQAMLAFGTTAAGTTMLSYAVDSFSHRAGEIGLLVNVVKNLFGFGLSYGAVQWWEAQGFLGQFGTMAGLLWAIYLPAIPMYFYGARIRAWAITMMKV